MELPDLIGQVLLSILGGSASAFALLKFWINHQFAKKLEQTKSEISLHAERRMKLHDKEYQVFPEIWSCLIDAKESLQAGLIEFRPMPDLSRMADDDFKKWLERTELEDDEKHEMLEADDRMAMFNRILDYRNLRKAEEAFFKFQTYLQKNRIFLSPEIKEKFNKIKELLRKASAARTADICLEGQASRADFLTKALDIFNDEVEPLMVEIENIIQGKLFPKRETNSQ